MFFGTEHAGVSAFGLSRAFDAAFNRQFWLPTAGIASGVGSYPLATAPPALSQLLLHEGNPYLLGIKPCGKQKDLWTIGVFFCWVVLVENSMAIPGLPGG